MFFFFNDTATTEIYTLSLHDALPIFLADSQTFSRTLPHALPCFMISFSVLKMFFLVFLLTDSLKKKRSMSRVVISRTSCVPKNGSRWFRRWPVMFKTVDGFISGYACSLHS